MTAERTARRMAMSVGLPLAVILAGPAAAKPAIGAPAPDFTATDSNGSSQSLAGYRGKFVVLEWTNHDCPFVRRHYETGNMQKLQKEATGKGVVWISVISSAPGRQGHVDGAQANALPAKRDAAPDVVVLDPTGKVGKLYDARTTPHMFVIDPQGTLVYMGGIDDNPTAWGDDVESAHNYVRAALGESMAGKAVSTPVARPYGCSVKYGS